MMEELFVYRKDVWEKTLRKIGFFLGKFIYLMDAYDDLEEDKKKHCYNPLIPLSEKPDYEERIKRILCMMIAECSAEILRSSRVLLDVDILRNILYDGVWNRYKLIQMKKRKERNRRMSQKSV